ncbi:hypothetical protein C7S13_7237 [Burkholderia cepacia]|nr:hypothetical protein [Burkholderia cepacia]
MFRLRCMILFGRIFIRLLDFKTTIQPAIQSVETTRAG